MSNGATLTILPSSEGAAEILARVQSGEASRIILLAPTLKAAREAVDPLVDCGETSGPRFLRSKKRLSWDNGATFTYFSSEEPDLLRGARCDTLWIERLDELFNLPKITDILGPIIRDPATPVVVTALSPTTLDAWRFLSFSLRAPLPPVRKATKNRLEIILSDQAERFNESLRKAQEAVEAAFLPQNPEETPEESKARLDAEYEEMKVDFSFLDEGYGEPEVTEGDALEVQPSPQGVLSLSGVYFGQVQYAASSSCLSQSSRPEASLGRSGNLSRSFLSPLVIGVALASAGLLASLVVRQRGHSSAASAAKLTAREAERGGHMSRTSSTDSS